MFSKTYSKKDKNIIVQAAENKDAKRRILFTVLMGLVIRFGSQVPAPAVNPAYFSAWFEETFADSSVLSMLTGGSFESMSIFAVGITPYITASIIMQLLTFAIPKLEEISKNGEAGKKLMGQITRGAAIIIALISSVSMAVSFLNQGLLETSYWQSAFLFAVSLTGGCAALIFIGDEITEKGVGNGISIVLLINILSGLPQDTASIFSQFVFSKGIAAGVFAAVVIIVIAAALLLYCVVLCEAERRIPIQSSRMTRGYVSGGSSDIPFKVNIAGVIPVIFASTLFQLPILISSMAGYSGSGIWGHILMFLNSSYWFNSSYPAYTAGIAVYLVLMVLFAYFYTQITFNPSEIAENLKKSGVFIPGIRPGKPTRDYIAMVTGALVFIGSCLTGILVVVCYAIFGLSGISVSVGATSLIIIASVILDTGEQIRAICAVPGEIIRRR